jgi:hypothetical protein
MYILNPDKEPLPWRGYCTVPPASLPPSYIQAPTSSVLQVPDDALTIVHPEFPPPNFDDLPPAGVFIGVFSMDSSFERRMLIRTTYANHPRSREGAGEGDGGHGTSRTVVRFVMGLPRKDWDRRIRLEMESELHPFFCWFYYPPFTHARISLQRPHYSSCSREYERR